MATSKNKSRLLMDYEIGNSTNSKSSISIVVKKIVNSNQLLKFFNSLNALYITRLNNKSTCNRSYASMGRMLFAALFIFCMNPVQIAIAQTDPELRDQALLQIDKYGDSLSVNRQNMSTDQFERDLWIQSSLRDLNQNTPKECLNPIVPAAFELGDEYQISFRLTGKDGCILLAGESWIYLLSNSVYENPEIGDITLAIDSHGNEYYNEGHVCGGTIRFYHRSQTPLELTETIQFFENFTSDTDQEGWIQLHNR